MFFLYHLLQLGQRDSESSSVSSFAVHFTCYQLGHNTNIYQKKQCNDHCHHRIQVKLRLEPLHPSLVTLKSGKIRNPVKCIHYISICSHLCLKDRVHSGNQVCGNEWKYELLQTVPFYSTLLQQTEVSFELVVKYDINKSHLSLTERSQKEWTIYVDWMTIKIIQKSLQGATLKGKEIRNISVKSYISCLWPPNREFVIQ